MDSLKENRSDSENHTEKEISRDETMAPMMDLEMGSQMDLTKEVTMGLTKGCWMGPTRVQMKVSLKD